MSSESKQTVRELEDRRCEAMVKDDLAALDALMAEDLIYTHSSALVDTKASYLESLKSGLVKYKKIDREDIEMRAHDNAVFVTGKARIAVRARGEDKTLILRYSNVWLKKDQGWQFALWHATPIPEGR